MQLSRSVSMPWTRRALAAGAALAALALAAEAVFWLGSTLAAPPAVAGRCAVLVLGYPSRADGSPDPTQRSRVAAGVRAFERDRCERLVLSGGAAHNEWVEAQGMAALAEQAGVPAASIAIEDRARNTWENVALSLPLLEGFDAVLVASEPLHALRAKRYLCRQRPAICDRVGIAPAYEPFARPWFKVACVGYEALAWARDRLLYEGSKPREGESP